MASEQQKKQKQQQWPLNFFLFVKQLIQKTKKNFRKKTYLVDFFYFGANQEANFCWKQTLKKKPTELSLHDHLLLQK